MNRKSRSSKGRSARSSRTSKSLKKGGSLASDRVLKHLYVKSNTKRYPDSQRINTESELGGTNTYELTGGSRRMRRALRSKRTNNKLSRSKKSKVNRKNKSNGKFAKRGGGSAWMASQYSLGPINNPEADTRPFSNSSAPSRNSL